MLQRGAGVVSLTVPMPEAKVWSPETPLLYRCRVTVQVDEAVSDACDAPFGCRSFELVQRGGNGGEPVSKSVAAAPASQLQAGVIVPN